MQEQSRIVRMPDGTRVRFPASMPDDEIRSMILTRFPEVGAQTQQPTTANNPWDEPTITDADRERFRAQGTSAPSRFDQEQAARALQIGAQSVGSGLAGAAGLPTDAVTGLGNLALQGVEATADLYNRVQGGSNDDVNLPRLNRSVMGSEWIRGTAADQAERLGVSPIERSEMTRAERLQYDAQTMATETMASGAGVVNAATQGGRAAASLLGRTLDEMAVPYRDTPGRTMFVEAAGGAGGGAAISELEQSDANWGLQLVGGFAGGMLGASTAGLVAYGPEAAYNSARGALPSRDMPGMSVGVVDEVARRLQSVTDNPQTTIGQIQARLDDYRSFGVTPPDAALLSGDRSLLSIRRGALASGDREYGTAFNLAGTRGDLAGVMGDSVDPEMRFPLDPNRAGSPARVFAGERGAETNVPSFAEARGETLIAEAATQADAALTQYNQTVSRLDNVINTFRQEQTRAPQYSGQLQDVVVDRIMRPIQAQRNALWNEAYRGNAAQQTRVDVTPVLSTYSRITAGDAPPEIPVRVSRPLMRVSERAQEQASSPQMSFADLMSVKREAQDALRAAQVSADSANQNTADALRGLLSDISAIETQIATQDTPLGRAMAEAFTFERERFAPYFRDPTEGLPGNRAGQRLREARRQDQFGNLEDRSGAESFANRFFFGTATDPAEIASDVRDIISLGAEQGDDVAGMAAARQYIYAAAATQVAERGSARSLADAVRTFMRRNDGVLSVFPEARGSLDQIANQINNLSGEAQQALGILEDAKIALRQAPESVRSNRVLGAAIGRDPINAVQAVMSRINSSDRVYAAQNLMSEINQYGGGRVRRAFQQTLMRYFDDTVRAINQAPATATGDDKFGQSIAQLNRLVMGSGDNTLEVLFEGWPEGLRALKGTRRMLNDISNERVTNLVGSASAENISLSQSVLNSAELPVRLMYGHLRGGGVMKSLRIALSRIPGLNNEDAINRAMVLSISDPDQFLDMLQRRVSDEQKRAQIINRIRATFYAQEAMEEEETEQ